jgi:membrane AbrB-like protein
MMQNNQAIPFNKENFKQIFSVSFVLVILISIPGAIIADFFNIPLAWFLGPMLVTSLASLMGLKIEMPRLILSSILILLGLYIGNYIDKSLFAQMHQWIWTSLIMLIYIILSVLIVSKYLQKFSKYEQKTSIFSAAPGALGPLMILAEDEKTDLSQVATSHLIRLIIIITVFPFIVNSFYDFEGVESAQKIIDNQNLSHLLILIITSVILIYFFDRLKLPAALLSGTLVASGLLQITDIAAYEISADIIDFCLLILGASVGCRFADKTFGEIGRNALHSFVATFLLVLLGLIAAFTASLIIDKNFFTLLLSYCPGGIYEVAVIAIFFDLDPEFVS